MRKQGHPRPLSAEEIKPTPTTEVEASRCRACGSTNRTGYHHVTVQEYAGVTGDGRPYTSIVRRRTECLDCGQTRIDRSFEYPQETP